MTSGTQHTAHERRACSRLSNDVCKYLRMVSPVCLVTQYNVGSDVAEHYTCMKNYLVIKDTVEELIRSKDIIVALDNKVNELNNELIVSNNVIQELNKEIDTLKSSGGGGTGGSGTGGGTGGGTGNNGSSGSSGSSGGNRKRPRDSDVDNLRSKIRKLESIVKSGSRRIKKANKRINNSNRRAQNHPPPSVPITSPSQWINRVKEVTHCQNLTEKCKMVCPACKWDYRKKEVQVKSHIAHLKAKHGGFTPSMVDGQNSHVNLIPKLLEVGEKEQERRGCRQQQQTRAMAASRRQSRLDQYNLNRAMVLPP